MILTLQFSAMVMFNGEEIIKEIEKLSLVIFMRHSMFILKLVLALNGVFD